MQCFFHFILLFNGAISNTITRPYYYLQCEQSKKELKFYFLFIINYCFTIINYTFAAINLNSYQVKSVKIVATPLFYITRILAILYLATTLYSLVSLLTEWSYFTKDSEKYFAICYPFTDKPFLNGENNWAYKVFNFLIPIGFYGLFFLLISNVFKVFKQPKLFTQYGINQLRYFYLANLTLPWITILLASIFAGKIEEGLEWVAIIHFFLGVFIYFLAAIFKQGLLLQNEQDLYI